MSKRKSLFRFQYFDDINRYAVKSSDDEICFLFLYLFDHFIVQNVNIPSQYLVLQFVVSQYPHTMKTVIFLLIIFINFCKSETITLITRCTRGVRVDFFQSKNAIQ